MAGDARQQPMDDIEILELAPITSVLVRRGLKLGRSSASRSKQFRNKTNKHVLKPSFLLLVSYLMLIQGIARAQISVTTYHNDKLRTGWTPSETVLTPANVTPATFGLVASV